MTGALQDRLQDRGLLPSTRAKYLAIVRATGSQDPVAWLEDHMAPETPIGTVLPLRAAVKHYLMAEEGYSEEEVEALLPKATGKRTQFRVGLTPEQLASYHAQVALIEKPAIRAILNLLPKSGLKISEACTLRPDSLAEEDGRLALNVTSSGGVVRTVPLFGSAEKLLQDYLKAHDPQEWLFLGYKGEAITPHAVRIYTRRMAETPGLEGLTPHTLRHTFAMMALESGIELSSLSKLLGHSAVSTTKRYLTS